MQTLRPGSLAPNFTLVGQDGSIFTLGDSLKRQPVALVFYPMDGSPNCNQLLCRINQDVDEFEAAGITIVGVNYAEPDVHKHYAARKFLRLPLLSDQQFRVAAAYDSLFHIGPIKVIRYSVAGIGQDSRIIYYQRGRPSNQQIIQSMQAARPPSGMAVDAPSA